MIKVGVIIENGEIKNISKLENATPLEISLIIANLEIVKSDLVSKLTSLTMKDSNALLKKGSDQASQGVGSATPQIQKPKDIINCSDKQYKILISAGYEDKDIVQFSKKQIRDIIGTYLNNLKRDNI